MHFRNNLQHHTRNYGKCHRVGVENKLPITVWLLTQVKVYLKFLKVSFFKIITITILNLLPLLLLAKNMFLAKN